MDGVDPTYEYIDAPKEVIDFTELAQRNPMIETHTDKWFGMSGPLPRVI
jgi:hypothetical protein